MENFYIMCLPHSFILDLSCFIYNGLIYIYVYIHVLIVFGLLCYYVAFCRFCLFVAHSVWLYTDIEYCMFCSESSLYCREKKCKPVFLQTAQQVVQLKAEDLRLPSRAWKVKLVGEGADDAGGVFDDTITEMCKVGDDI